MSMVDMLRVDRKRIRVEDGVLEEYEEDHTEEHWDHEDDVVEAVHEETRNILDIHEEEEDEPLAVQYEPRASLSNCFPP